MSFTYSAGGAMPLPNLAWDFNGTTTPYIGSATTSVTGSVSYSAGKYIQAVNIVNTPTGTPGTGANYITWTNYGTFNPSVGVTACFWINVNALPASGQQSIALWMRGSAVNSAVYINLTPTNWSPFYTDGTNYYGPTSSTPLSTGVWYHLTVVVGGGTVTGYQNGVQIASPVAFSNPLDVSGFLYIGGSGNFGPTSALYDDLRIYNSALTVAQVQSIYNQQGMPGRGALGNVVGSDKTSLTGTPLFSQISTAASSSAVGAFSLRAVNGTSAKAVQVRNGTTSATQDFYADRLGNLLTAPVVGQSLAKWLGGATGYVATWYDQSGKGSHMSCSSTALQPKIDLVNKWIDFKTTAYFDVSATPSTGPVPWDNTKNYTVLCRHNSIGNNLGGLFGVSNAAPNFNTTSYTNNFRRDTAGYQNYWYFKDFSAGTYAIGNKVTWKWDGTNRYMYTNGTLNATQSQLSTDWLQTSSSGQVIGAQTVTGAGNYMNGEMYSIFMFNSALSDTDRLLVENY